MASERTSSVGLSIAVAFAIIGLIVAVQASLGATRARNGFRQEMAQRLDIEERLESAQKEKAVLAARVESLSAEADRVQQEAVAAREAYERERAEKTAMAAELERARQASAAAVPAAAQT